MKYAIKLLLELCSHYTGGGNHKGIYLYGGNCSLTLFLLKSVGTLPVTKFSFRDLSQGGRSLIILALIHVKNWFKKSSLKLNCDGFIWEWSLRNFLLHHKIYWYHWFHTLQQIAHNKGMGIWLYANTCTCSYRLVNQNHGDKWPII